MKRIFIAVLIMGLAYSWAFAAENQTVSETNATAKTVVKTEANKTKKATPKKHHKSGRQKKANKTAGEKE